MFLDENEYTKDTNYKKSRYISLRFKNLIYLVKINGFIK